MIVIVMRAIVVVRELLPVVVIVAIAVIFGTRFVVRAWNLDSINMGSIPSAGFAALRVMRVPHRSG